MTILSARPLTVKVTRSGGIAGLCRVSEHVAEPGTAAHDAALAVLRAHRRRPTEPPPRRPDAFSYDLSIASPGHTVLHRRFREPLPDDVAQLLAALASSGAPPPAAP